MIPAHDLLLFVAASTALALAPGPDNLFVLAQSALHGARAGLLVTFGLCSGLLIHIAAVALGVAALIRTSALAFAVMKAIGAAYLLYLAWRAFAAASSAGQAAPEIRCARALYLRGVLMNVSNPKVAIFFLAFLPQFADPTRGSVTVQIVQLGLVFLLCALTVFVLVALAAGRLGLWLKRSPHAHRLMNRVAGTVFALLALRLLASRQLP